MGPVCPKYSHVRGGSALLCPQGLSNSVGGARPLLRFSSQDTVSGTISPNLVIIRKKDGTPRTCVGLRKVNMATRFDCYPLARIDESLDALGGAKFINVYAGQLQCFLVYSVTSRGQRQDSVWNEVARAARVQEDVVWVNERHGNVREGPIIRIKGAVVEGVCSIL